MPTVLETFESLLSFGVVFCCKNNMRFYLRTDLSINKEHLHSLQLRSLYLSLYLSFITCIKLSILMFERCILQISDSDQIILEYFHAFKLILMVRIGLRHKAKCETSTRINQQCLSHSHS